jgi:ABC-type uncharacterized transport system ATPase subunit
VKRDWDKEWEQEQAEVDGLVAMFEKYNACDHVWIADKGEHVALSWIEHICVKCGGAKAVVDNETYRLLTEEPLLPNDQRGSHCL